VTQAEQVRTFFDGEADRFQAIYSREKAVSQRLVDFLFRRVIHQRFQLTLDLCGSVEGKKILDVGCGPGNYCVEFARRGAQVVGLDFAPAMVERARTAAAIAGFEERCNFEVGDRIWYFRMGKVNLPDCWVGPGRAVAKFGRSVIVSHGGTCSNSSW